MRIIESIFKTATVVMSSGGKALFPGNMQLQDTAVCILILTAGFFAIGGIMKVFMDRRLAQEALEEAFMGQELLEEDYVGEGDEFVGEGDEFVGEAEESSNPLEQALDILGLGEMLGKPKKRSKAVTSAARSARRATRFGITWFWLFWISLGMGYSTYFIIMTLGPPSSLTSFQRFRVPTGYVPSTSYRPMASGATSNVPTTSFRPMAGGATSNVPTTSYRPTVSNTASKPTFPSYRK